MIPTSYEIVKKKRGWKGSQLMDTYHNQLNLSLPGVRIGTSDSLDQHLYACSQPISSNLSLSVVLRKVQHHHAPHHRLRWKLVTGSGLARLADCRSILALWREFDRVVLWSVLRVLMFWVFWPSLCGQWTTRRVLKVSGVWKGTRYSEDTEVSAEGFERSLVWSALVFSSVPGVPENTRSLPKGHP